MADTVELDPGNTLTGTPLASQEIASTTLGPLAIAWTLQIFLYGFATCALVYYLASERWQRDNKKLKIFVTIVFLLATAQAGLSFYQLFHYVTFQQRSVEVLYSQGVSDSLSTLFVGFEAAGVQIFLGRRATTLFKNRILKLNYQLLVYLCILASWAGAMMYLVVSFLYRSNYDVGNLFRVATGLWLISAAVVDVLISTTLVIILKQNMSNFDANTDNMLRALIKLAVESASYTAIFALIGAILSFAIPADAPLSNMQGVFFHPLSALYLLSVIVTLSARDKIQAIGQGTRSLQAYPSDFLTAHSFNTTSQPHANNLQKFHSSTTTNKGFQQTPTRIVSAAECDLTNHPLEIDGQEIRQTDEEKPFSVV